MKGLTRVLGSLISNEEDPIVEWSLLYIEIKGIDCLMIIEIYI